MSATKDTGGPAFPLKIGPVAKATSFFGFEVSEGHSAFVTGMSLRDYFAGKAISDAVRLEEVHPTGPRGEASYDGIGRRAYLIADAMLKARGAA